MKIVVDFQWQIFCRFSQENSAYNLSPKTSQHSSPQAKTFVTWTSLWRRSWIQKVILGIWKSNLGMASHDLSNTKATILGATPWAIPQIEGNPHERLGSHPALKESPGPFGPRIPEESPRESPGAFQPRRAKKCTKQWLFRDCFGHFLTPRLLDAFFSRIGVVRRVKTKRKQNISWTDTILCLCSAPSPQPSPGSGCGGTPASLKGGGGL